MIHRHKPNDYKAVEHGILRCVGIARRVEWTLIERRLIDHDGRSLEQITIETKATTAIEIVTQLESYYFDITECLDLDDTTNTDVA